MSSHVVLAVELLMTNLAWVWVPLQMCSDIVSVKVAGVCVGIVANLAAIRVLWWSFICAETSNADWSWVFWGPQAIGTVGIEVCQFRFNLFLHLEVHQVRTWTR